MLTLTYGVAQLVDPREKGMHEISLFNLESKNQKGLIPKGAEPLIPGKLSRARDTARYQGKHRDADSGTGMSEHTDEADLWHSKKISQCRQYKYQDGLVRHAGAGSMNASAEAWGLQEIHISS